MVTTVILLIPFPTAYFFPKTIFFYVKLNNDKQKFPDDKHAIKVNEIKNIVLKINQNIMTL